MDSNSIRFSDAWEFFPCNIKNYPFTIRFDTAVVNLDKKVKDNFPHILELSIHVYEIDDQGYPSTAEQERINNIEDKFSCGTYEIRHIGVLTGANFVRFIFCYNGVVGEDDKSLIQTLLGDEPYNFEYDYKILPDDNFAYFYDNIAPNIYEHNWIMNRHVCANLENAGEVFQTPREVDFSCTFASEQHIQNVADKLRAHGFIERDRHRTDNGVYWLEMVLEGIPTFSWANQAVANVLDSMDGTDGCFDGWGSPVIKSDERV